MLDNPDYSLLLLAIQTPVLGKLLSDCDESFLLLLDISSFVAMIDTIAYGVRKL